MAVAEGEVISIEAVADEVFSQKMMGDGFAVEPASGDIYAPISGTVVSVFPTKHAIGLQTESGLEVLVHMGLDTVEMKESAFTILVQDGQKITAGDKIAEADLSKIRAEGKGTTIIVVFTNSEKIQAIHLDKKGIQAGKTIIGSVEL
ncbi:PTS sugar transporter subunit IIA [Enterococcus larvae]|uniref:PTS sugar transporter subunit IIA n=1 Tax=Enterococcus larvae TaxID=2794352 RepID=UPI003F2BEF06